MRKANSAIKNWQDIDTEMLGTQCYEKALEKIYARSLQRKQLAAEMNNEGVTWADVVKNQDESLQKIHKWLATSDKEFSCLKEVEIEQDHKKRKIYTLNLLDKWVLTTLSNLLSESLAKKWSNNL